MPKEHKEPSVPADVRLALTTVSVFTWLTHPSRDRSVQRRVGNAKRLADVGDRVPVTVLERLGNGELLGRVELLGPTASRVGLEQVHQHSIPADVPGSAPCNW